MNRGLVAAWRIERDASGAEVRVRDDSAGLVPVIVSRPTCPLAVRRVCWPHRRIAP